MADIADLITVVVDLGQQILSKLDDIESSLLLAAHEGAAGSGQSGADQAEKGGGGGGSDLPGLGKLAGAVAVGGAAKQLISAGAASAIAGGGDANAIKGGLLREALGLAGKIPGLEAAVDSVRGPYDQAQKELESFSNTRAALGSPLSEDQLRGQFELSLARAKRVQENARNVKKIADQRFLEDTQKNFQKSGEVIQLVADLGLLGEEARALSTTFRAIRINAKAGGF